MVAHSHVSNCLSKEQIEFAKKRFLLSCYIATGDQSPVRLFTSADIETEYVNVRADHVDMAVTRIVNVAGQQFLCGHATDQNGYLIARLDRETNASETEWCILSADSTCDLIQPGYVSNSRHVDNERVCETQK